MRSDVEKVLGDVRRQLDAVGAGWGRAMAQARLEEDAPGVSAVRFDREGGSGGGPSRPTEDAALRRRRSPAGDLEAALAEAADAVHRLAGLVASSVPARMVDGRVACVNRFGCPEEKRARREGLCYGCWAFRDTNGRDRHPDDYAEALKRGAAGGRVSG